MKAKSVKKTKSRSVHIRGISAAPGIALGHVYLLEKSLPQVSHYWISNRELPQELQRFKNAIEKTREELSKIKDRLCRYEGTTQIRILDSYQMILQDEILIKNTLESIKSERINAEWALQKTLDLIPQCFFSNLIQMNV